MDNHDIENRKKNCENFQNDIIQRSKWQKLNDLQILFHLTGIEKMKKSFTLENSNIQGPAIVC